MDDLASKLWPYGERLEAAQAALRAVKPDKEPQVSLRVMRRPGIILIMRMDPQPQKHMPVVSVLMMINVGFPQKFV